MGNISELPGLLPLVPFMRGGEQLATVERAARLLQERVSEPEHQLIAEMLLERVKDLTSQVGHGGDVMHSHYLPVRWLR